MAHLIDKDALVAETKQRIINVTKKIEESEQTQFFLFGQVKGFEEVLNYLNSLEAKEADLMIHTIIAECCDWLAAHTELNHEQIEDCRNLMLTVKDEQLKAKQS